MYFACICYKKETDEDWKCMNISGYLILEILLEIIRKQLSIIKYKSLSSIKVTILNKKFIFIIMHKLHLYHSLEEN